MSLGDATAARSSTAKRVKLLTVNVWQSAQAFAKRMDAIAAFIKARRPDVVALQEVSRTPRRENSAERIAKKSGYNLVYRKVWLEPKPKIEMGLAFLARGKIRRATRMMLPRIPKMETRGCLFAEIETPAGPIWFANPHLDYRPEETPYREKQVVAIATKLRALKGPRPPILMGDLNSAPEESPVQYLLGRSKLDGDSICLGDAWTLANNSTPGFTWDNRNPWAKAWKLHDRRIDYVLLAGSGACGSWPRATRSYRVAKAELVFTEAGHDGVFPTDHFGLWVEVDVVSNRDE